METFRLGSTGGGRYNDEEAFAPCCESFYEGFGFDDVDFVSANDELADLLCLQIVALLRSREAQNENAEKISVAAAKMYEKFVGFSDTFSDIGKRIDGLTESYRKANGQLCDGNANVVRQLERLKEMGIVTTKTINHKMLDDAMAVDT